jgi:hypothetical protein
VSILLEMLALSVPASHGVGTLPAKEASGEAIFNPLNLKKSLCSVSVLQVGTFGSLTLRLVTRYVALGLIVQIPLIE